MNGARLLTGRWLNDIKEAGGNMRITLVVNRESWIISFAKKLLAQIRQNGHRVRLIYELSKIEAGDLAFFLSWEKIVPETLLKLHAHNLVVHESALPKGRGWSPLTWQILQGKKRVPVTLFEAEKDVDSGPIYLQRAMRFRGHELIDELRRVQGKETIMLVMEFIRKYSKSHNVKGKKQKGKATYYQRRRPKDSELDPQKTLIELFNQLRVADNEKYPAFFRHRGHKYVLKISKEDENE